MTKEERMAKIQTKAANDKKAEEEKRNAAKREYERLAAEIAGLYDRVNDILDVVNACIANGVTVPFHKEYGGNERYGENAKSGFFADGIIHNVGFDRRQCCGESKKILRLSIENGGANGPYNFFVDGEDFYWRHEDREVRRREEICREPKSWKYDMEKFIKEFPLFEAAFYSWVDSLA